MAKSLQKPTPAWPSFLSRRTALTVPFSGIEWIRIVRADASTPMASGVRVAMRGIWVKGWEL